MTSGMTLFMTHTQQSLMPNIYLDRIETILDRIAAECLKLSSLFGNSGEQQFLSSIPNVVSTSKNTKILLIKARKKVLEITGSERILSPSTQSKLQDAYYQSLNALEYASRVSSEAKLFKENPAPSRISDFVADAGRIAELCMSTSETFIGGSLLQFFQIFEKGLLEFIEFTGEEDLVQGKELYLLAVTPTPPPWQMTSDIFKQEFSVNSDLRVQVDNLQEQVMSLIKELKIKEQEGQVLEVKIQVLEKRAETGEKSVSSLNNARTTR